MGYYPVDTLFAFRAGSDPANVLRESGVTKVPLTAMSSIPLITLDLDRILIVPEDIDGSDGIHPAIKPILKANRVVMNTEERKIHLYGGDVTAIYLGSNTYFSEAPK